jgi:hypothetical protein
MSKRPKWRWGPAALAAVLLGLTACAKAMSPMEETTVDPLLQNTVQTMLANHEAGRVKTVSGAGYVVGPIAVAMANGEVSLIPSAPALEATLAQLQRRWLAGRRQPLPFEAFQTAFIPLTQQRIAVGRAGGESLIRFASTDEQGRFHFEGVPQGRWLLVADMSSPVSTILWALPIQVEAEDPLPLLLFDGNILFEVRKLQTPPTK